MDRRLELQETLEEIAHPHKVFYQPSQSTVLQYPCVVYYLSDYAIDFADDSKYKKDTQYTVTVISARPDIEMVEQVLMLPMTKFLGVSVSDNLYHYRFNIYI